MTGRPPYRTWMRLLGLVRLVAVVLALQLSGAAHTLFDVLILTDSAEEHEQCPANGPCDECPPGCPNCHCANTLRSALPINASSLGTESVSTGALSFTEARAPSAPDLPLPFRPPRTALVS